MRTSQAVTGAGGIPIGYGTLAVVYAVLGIAAVWALRRLQRSPLEGTAEVPGGRGAGMELR
jgi:cytochrome bd ubiquinol oxidase subunit I